MNAHNEQHFTAADMADQAAAAFERGRESVLAELVAAAQVAVCWQRKYIGATRGDRPVEWHTITKDEFEATKAGKWADRYEVRALYAAPVTAAPPARRGRMMLADLLERLQRRSRVLRDTALMRTRFPEWLVIELEQAADDLDEAAKAVRAANERCVT